MKISMMATEAIPECLIGMDRRSEPRSDEGRLVMITNLPTMEVLMPAHLTDMSRCGLGLELAYPINPGATFAVEWEETIVLAEVAYCIQDDDQYRAGLRINYIIVDRTASKPKPM